MRGLPRPGAAPCRLFRGVAERYRRTRPRYPGALFGSLVAQAGLLRGDAVPQVGTGTGIATGGLIWRGLRVTGPGPSPKMAAVAGATLGPTGRLLVLASSFEDWLPAHGGFPPVTSARGWPSVDP